MDSHSYSHSNFNEDLNRATSFLFMCRPRPLSRSCHLKRTSRSPLPMIKSPGNSKATTSPTSSWEGIFPQAPLLGNYKALGDKYGYCDDHDRGTMLRF